MTVFTMRRRRDGQGVSRARTFWLDDCRRAIDWGRRLTGRYGLEYIRVEAATRSGPLLLYRWLKGEEADPVRLIGTGTLQVPDDSAEI